MQLIVREFDSQGIVAVLAIDISVSERLGSAHGRHVNEGPCV